MKSAVIKKSTARLVSTSDVAYVPVCRVQGEQSGGLAEEAHPGVGY